MRGNGQKRKGDQVKKQTDKTYHLVKGEPYPLGAVVKHGGVNFCVALSSLTVDALFQETKPESCSAESSVKQITRTAFTVDQRPGTPAVNSGSVKNQQPEAEPTSRLSLCLYHPGEATPFCQLDFTEEYRIGDLYFARLEPLPPKDCTYSFLLDGVEFCDPAARSICGREVFGREPGPLRGQFVRDTYDWDGDCAPQIAYEDAILYTGHVRHLTMDPSARVKKKGTFAGIIERIPYLQALGINMLELQPVYEFGELLPRPVSSMAYFARSEKQEHHYKKNCWGYGPGFYFAPKASFAWGKDAGKECKDLVKALHRAGIELILEFYFPAHTYPGLMVDCLKYWLLEYHVDGFHISGFDLPLELIAREPLLAGVKLLGNGFRTEEIYPDGHLPKVRRLAEVHDGPQMDMRRFLRGEEGQIGGFAARLRNNPTDRAVVNYVASHNGFTLADLVCYEEKHNEANGEDNRDGSDYNCSCNYGEEGKSRKKKINDIRARQVRNALLMVFLAQGVPCLHAGDECGNSQQGNNNAYGLDDPTAWIQYDRSRAGDSLRRFTEKLIAFRKAHRVFHQAGELQGMDVSGCGCPDISFHGRHVWYPEFDGVSRQLGVLYAGAGVGDSYFYTAYNMYGEEKSFALPHLPKGMCWERVIDTSLPEAEMFPESPEQKALEAQKEMIVKGRTVVVLEGRLPGGKDDTV